MPRTLSLLAIAAVALALPLAAAAQTEPQTFVAMAEADQVLGNAEKLSAAG